MGKWRPQWQSLVERETLLRVLLLGLFKEYHEDGLDRISLLQNITVTNPNVQQLTAYLIHNYIDNSLSTVVVEGVRRASLYCCGALGFILQVFFF